MAKRKMTMAQRRGLKRGQMILKLMRAGLSKSQARKQVNEAETAYKGNLAFLGR
jgi:hypothetical protein